METRALAIAFFYAVGTAVGGITGPLLFGKLIETGKEANVFWGYILGASLMIVAGIVQAVLGIEAARRDLEDIAKPLSAEAAEGDEEQKPRPAAARRRASARASPARPTRPSSSPPRACPTRTSTRRSRRSSPRCARRATRGSTARRSATA